MPHLSAKNMGIKTLDNFSNTEKTNQISCLEIDLGGESVFPCYLIDSKVKSPTCGACLSFDEIIELICQATALGVQTIVLINNDNEPHPNTSDILAFIQSKNLQVDVFSPPDRFDLVKSVFVQCLKHKYSCFIRPDGIVYPCIGVPLPIGDIRKDSLEKILTDSEIVQHLKNHTTKIKGPCRECKDFSHCYGCRGRAFSLTKDYLASDLLCPVNQDKLDQITYLPMSAKNLIPQKKGMLVVQRILEIGERYAKVETCFTKENPFVKPDGSIEEMAYMEIMAQSAAAMNGFEKFDTGAPDPGGFLIGGQKIIMHAKTYAGQILQTDIYKTTKFGSFGILSATIKRGKELIAQGEIKIFENNGADNAI